MKIISWNVNGIRAWIQKTGSMEFLEKEKPDIICLQETKATREQVEEFFEKEDTPLFATKSKNVKEGKLFPDYSYHFWNSAEKKGYSGTAIFSKGKPLSESYGIGDGLDSEGRVITLEFKDFFLVNVYTPNSKPDLSRVDYRKDIWDKNFLKHLKKLDKKKPVIACGDFNVAHQEIDLKNPQANKTTEKSPGHAGFTDKERQSFERYLKNGFIDTFRFLHPDEVKYSWWSYRFNARKNNAGWRIDYFLISERLKDKLKKAEIHNEAYGSDHCPVSIEIF